MNPRAVLLTDLDNTLFSWIDYFAPSIRALVEALSSAAGVPECEVYEQLRDVHRRYSAAEHPRVVDELEMCRNRDPGEREALALLGYEAFEQARTVHLKTYPGVAATLTRLREHGVVVVGVTSSSVYDAVSRTEALGLATLLDTIVAWEGIPGVDLPSRTALARRVVPVMTGRLKPSRIPYQIALAWCGVECDVPVWVVGDSIANDLVPAREIGARTVWARYGHAYDPANLETVKRVTFWSAEKIKSAYDFSILEPDETIDEFGRLINLVVGDDVPITTHPMYANSGPSRA
ncbi:HAD family hydrolase [Actinomadura citrea]|uniref:HAD family hydrolase n=1 Tax=Actinomadura citrea TaxID=46158 RepID=UPI003CE567BA